MANGAGNLAGTWRAKQNIVLLADGTGNSSGALCKTNVWRLYQALHLGPPTASALRQIAYYHDGVGTSSFKPLALLGGAVGWGLKRNILDLYTFLCRNYQPGDRIYAFGFSRGAFTIRLLVALIVDQGILECSEEELTYATRDAYRKYRYSFNQTGGLVRPLRWLRDRAISVWRRLNSQTPYSSVEKHHPEGIEFLGVWDTVSAYGLPLAELTRGIDDWVWPLSMPNYKLSDKVRRARHALALDDERDTFHPLLWDEQHEESLIKAKKVRGDRLQQVWFAGVHSDVGGGYPDDALAHVPLDWMMSEATQAGLRFDADAVKTIRRTMSEDGPMHDSRRGVGGYYRYQPRKISARTEPRDRTTLIMQDPDLHYGLLRSVNVHASVLNRIRLGTDFYAPIVLPEAYGVIGQPQAQALAETPQAAHARAALQEGVWNQVWKKRVTYFATVTVSLFLAALPAMQTAWPPAACEGPQCLLAPAISSLGVVLPGFAQTWVDAFARTPGIFAVAILVLAFLLQRSENLQSQIRDGMRRLWANPPLEENQALPTNWIYKLRTNTLYQRGLQFVKWKVFSVLFGWATLAIGIVILFSGGVMLVNRVQIVVAERSGDRLCKEQPPSTPVPAIGQIATLGTFDTTTLCWPTGLSVDPGVRYRIGVRVTGEWFDTKRIPASPVGYGPERMDWGLGYLAIPLRRSITNRWFQPLAKVVSEDGSIRIYPLEMRRSDTTEIIYTADFVPRRKGSVFLFVNDALFLPWGQQSRFYQNNKGEGSVWLERIPGES